MNVGLDVVSVGKKDKKYCPVQCWSFGGKKKDKKYCPVQCWRVIFFRGLIVGSLTVLFGLLECKVS